MKLNPNGKTFLNFVHLLPSITLDPSLFQIEKNHLFYIGTDPEPLSEFFHQIQQSKQFKTGFDFLERCALKEADKLFSKPFLDSWVFFNPFHDSIGAYLAGGEL